MIPSEQEIGSPGPTSERRQPELALRSSREFTPRDLSETKASSSSTLVKPHESLSSPEPRLLLARGSSSPSKSRSSSNVRTQNHEPLSIASQYPSHSLYDSNSIPKNIIVRSFAPRVAVFASPDTEDFIREKGFRDGLHSLLRPYGERLQGRIVIRDSVGGSRGWDDFGIRFINSQALQEASAHPPGGDVNVHDARDLVNGSQRISEPTRFSYGDEIETSIDRVLGSYLRTKGAALKSQENGHVDFKCTQYEQRLGPSPLYLLYLRKLLSSASIVPYETFSHPVACLIAVSSRHPAPIEALRQLYVDTGHEGKKIPAWMGTEYLRYYVLFHDEENDDITKSTALFDLMKRHFGLHCHLLRLRRSRCVLTDDDSTRVPSCEWLTAEEEIQNIDMKGRRDCSSSNYSLGADIGRLWRRGRLPRTLHFRIRFRSHKELPSRNGDSIHRALHGEQGLDMERPSCIKATWYQWPLYVIVETLDRLWYSQEYDAQPRRYLEPLWKQLQSSPRLLPTRNGRVDHASAW